MGIARWYPWGPRTPNPGINFNQGWSRSTVYRVAQKIGTIILYALTLPNINRFSKLFQYQNQDKICNNTIAKDPTTPQV